jgi:hypothetical protein
LHDVIEIYFFRAPNFGASPYKIVTRSKMVDSSGDDEDDFLIIVSLFTLLLTHAHAGYLAVTREPSLFEQQLVWDGIVDKFADMATFHRPLLCELDVAPVVIVDVGPQGAHIKNDHRGRLGSMVSSHSLTLSLTHFCKGSQIGGRISLAIWMVRRCASGSFGCDVTTRTWPANLCNGCVQALKDCKVDEENIFQMTVPGAFELPMAARFLA